MNKAVPKPIDREAAASLIEPLTDLVIRAGHAILAVNRAAMTVDGKTDGSPVTEADLARHRRPRCRTAHAERRRGAAHRADPDAALPAPRKTLDGRHQPFAQRQAKRSLYRGATGRHPLRTRLGGEIRPGRRRIG